MDLNVSGFIIFLKLLDLFKIYALKHTGVTIYLTIMYTPPASSKQIAVRALRRIKDVALAEDLDRFNVDQGCVNVDIMIEQYDKYLSDLLDRHAPKKNI